MGAAQGVVAFRCSVLGLFFGACDDLLGGRIEAVHHADVLEHVNGLTGLQVCTVQAFRIAFTAGSGGLQGVAFGAHRTVHGGGDVEV